LNIIILTDRHGAARALTLSLPVLLAAGAALIAVPVMVAVLTWSVLSDAPQPVTALDSDVTWEETLADIDTESSAGSESQAQLEHMTQPLGERLTELADMSDGEFDFGADPGMGGPELLNSSERHEGPDVQTVLDKLADRIDSRTQQLKLLEEMMVSRSVDSNALLDFKPVHQGHISSGFGRRSDPLTGRIAMHTGLDFAAPRGTPIFAVGAGVVTWSRSPTAMVTKPATRTRIPWISRRVTWSAKASRLRP